MTCINDLPLELLFHIGDLLVWDDSYVPSHHLSSTRALAALACTNHLYYDIFNQLLYKQNLHVGPPVDSCALWAARHGNLDTLRRAHERGADLSANGTRDENDYSIPWEDIPGVSRVIASPLHFDIKYGHRHIFNYLAQNVRFDVGCRDLVQYDRSSVYHLKYPIYFAVWKDDEMPGALEELIHRGARNLCPQRTVTAGFLIENGAIGVAERLLESGCTISWEDGLKAAMFENRSMAKDLVNNPGVDVRRISRVPAADESRQLRGMSLLHYAAGFKDVDQSFLAQLLERPELDVSTVTEDLETPLHMAARSGHANTVKLLLRRLDTQITTNRLGDTPLDLALKRGDRDIVEALTQRCDGTADITFVHSAMDICTERAPSQPGKTTASPQDTKPQAKARNAGRVTSDRKHQSRQRRSRGWPLSSLFSPILQDILYNSVVALPSR